MDLRLIVKNTKSQTEGEIRNLDMNFVHLITML
jgi:hypothetical protein